MRCGPQHALNLLDVAYGVGSTKGILKFSEQYLSVSTRVKAPVSN